MVMASKLIQCFIYTLILLAVILCLGFLISISNEQLSIWPFNVFWPSRAQMKTPLIETRNCDQSREAKFQINDSTSKLLERANKVIADGNNHVPPLIPWLEEGEKAEAYIDTTQVNFLLSDNIKKLSYSSCNELFVPFLSYFYVRA